VDRVPGVDAPDQTLSALRACTKKSTGLKLSSPDWGWMGKSKIKMQNDTENGKDFGVPY
jgi:hypothetical protein